MAKFIPVEPEKWAEMVKAQAEVARLKAEVEQSKRINTELLVLSERQASDIRRLTKAGDAMMGWIDRQHDDSGYPFSEAWEAAKQGGQP